MCALICLYSVCLYSVCLCSVCLCSRQTGLLLTVMAAPLGICRRKALLRLVMERWKYNTGKECLRLLSEYFKHTATCLPHLPAPSLLFCFLSLTWLPFLSTALTSPHSPPSSKMLLRAIEWRNKTSWLAQQTIRWGSFGTKVGFLCATWPQLWHHTSFPEPDLSPPVRLYRLTKGNSMI